MAQVEPLDGRHMEVAGDTAREETYGDSDNRPGRGRLGVGAPYTDPTY